MFEPYEDFVKNNPEPAPKDITRGPGGCKLVRVKGKHLWKRETRVISQAQQERMVMDGSDELQTACMKDRMGA